MNLKLETLQRIDGAITHCPGMRSATLPLLHLIQEDIGRILDKAIEWGIVKLDVQPSNVYEIVTFCPMFSHKPVGRRHIKVCGTLSCALMGSHKGCDTFKKEFGIELDETTPEGRVTVEFVKCFASCGTALIVMTNKRLHENMNEAKTPCLRRRNQPTLLFVRAQKDKRK